ncbi:MAG: response regulator transcription factor [Litorimonas sp.]
MERAEETSARLPDVLPPRVLLVEDDASVRAQIAAAVRAEGLGCDTAGSLCEARARLESGMSPDIAILDRSLGDGDGLSLIGEIARAAPEGRPVRTLVLSALGETRHRVEGLDAGADDYLVKPFDVEELRARLRALARRVRRNARPRITRHGRLEIDRSARTAHVAERHLKLSPKSYDLLLYLSDNYGALVTRAMLLEHVWKLSFDPQTNVVDVSISRLRRQFADLGEPGAIENVRGKGFILRLEKEA